jgi:UDP-4-amino-4,6-dideoxy-N-acetyl-beta-L-altrosamine N-acetyltransferase
MDFAQLRPIQESDLPIILAWRNSPRIRMAMFNEDIITLEEHQKWFQRIQSDPNAIYLIFEIGSFPVGTVNFTSIDRKNQRCLWGFYIGLEDLPKGTGFRMGCLALDYAFELLNMRKICGEVLANNLPSRNFHRKLGFSEEGHFKEHVLKGDTYHDVVLFSLLKNDWLARQP